LARRSYEWVDDDTIAALVVPEGRGLPPPRPPAPIGPSIQDNTDGRTSQVPAIYPLACRPALRGHAPAVGAVSAAPRGPHDRVPDLVASWQLAPAEFRHQVQAFKARTAIRPAGP